jgi:hypothetical protein
MNYPTPEVLQQKNVVNLVGTDVWGVHGVDEMLRPDAEDYAPTPWTAES